METMKIRSADGTALHVVRASPEATPTRDILLVHGLAEHMGRYTHVFEKFNAQGYRVTGFDFRGHGDSAGKRGHVSHWSDYVADLEAAAAQIAGNYTIVAHSMGAFVTLCALRSGLSHRPEQSVISGPLLGVAFDPPRWKTAAAGVLSRLAPRVSIGNEVDTQYLCRDPAVVEKYNADPKVFGTVTPRWYTELLSQQALVRSRAARYTDRLLLLVGGDDQICDPNITEQFASEVGPSASFKRYPGLYHELLNEVEHQDILDEIISWIESGP